MTRPGVLLHVGHGKTGSSALQAALAVNVERLAEHGIAYPVNRSVEKAAQGRTSWGNCEPLKLAESYEAARAAHPDARQILLSSEMAFDPLRQDSEQVDRLRALAADIRLILFIRDPFAHALSAYNHMVRRNGETGDVGVMLRRYERPMHVAEFVTRYRSMGIPVETSNYSRHHADLPGRFGAMLGLAPGTLRPHPARVVNRSLTPSEIMLQRQFNSHCGSESQHFIGNRLCDALPDLPVGPPRISRDQYRAFAERVAPMLARANTLLPEGEAYRLEPYEEVMQGGQDDPEALYSFSERQLGILAESISGCIPKSAMSDAFLDVVERLQNGATLGQEELVVLTRMGFALRPGNRRLMLPGKLKARADQPRAQSPAPGGWMARLRAWLGAGG